MTKVAFDFMDVGMGDGTLVCMGEDNPATQELALIDFGAHPCTQFKVGADDALTYLVKTITEASQKRNLNYPFLDYLFLTHGDSDHYNRIESLIDATYAGLKGKLVIGSLTFGGVESEYGKLITDVIKPVLKQPTIKALPNKTCSTISLGKVNPFKSFQNGAIVVYLLSANYPTAKSPKKNPKSLCLMFEHVASGYKVVLMGDAEAAVETQIIENFDKVPGFLETYALKLGHHGSKNGTSLAWLAKAKPAALFATGDFVWAHPYCETIQRVIDTKRLGKLADNHYCCGVSITRYRSNYNNHPTDLQVGLNLWYVVQDVKNGGETMIDQETQGKAFELAGTTYGVQWELEISGMNLPTMRHTDSSLPKG